MKRHDKRDFEPAFFSFLNVRCIPGLLTALLLCGSLWAEEELVIEAAQAGEHVGEVAMVCGIVADTHYAQASTGRPTYINFEEPFPNAPFTAVIWGSDRSSFPYDPAVLLGMDICVYGEVGRYRGKPQMKLVRPEQIGRKE